MSERRHISQMLLEAMDHYRQGELGQANMIYDRILARQAKCYEALEWSGEIAIQQDDYERAAQHLGLAKKVDPKRFADFANLGLAYYELDQPMEAVENLMEAIKYDAEDLVAHSNLGKALYELHNAGQVSDAARIAGRWMEEFSHIPDAKHMGAAVSGITLPDKADAVFVTETFDDFSEDFDKKLAELNYRAPEFIGAVIAKNIGTPQRDLCILDAGCGTGLAGPYLRPYAEKLTGVDLSQKMLNKAKSRGGYDELVQSELVDFMQTHKQGYDLSVAADVLCYFGDLTNIFKATAGCLYAGGYFAFSLELADRHIEKYILNASGRYAHDESYIADRLAAASFDLISFDSEILRSEHGKPVKGLVILAKRRRFR